eukprot:COSAG05_NODE_950_length_6467_cov_231.083857_6_plen_126_part_00
MPLLPTVLSAVVAAPSLSLSLSLCVCVCVRARVCVCVLIYDGTQVCASLLALLAGAYLLYCLSARARSLASYSASYGVGYLVFGYNAQNLLSLSLSLSLSVCDPLAVSFSVHHTEFGRRTCVPNR